MTPMTPMTPMMAMTAMRRHAVRAAQLAIALVVAAALAITGSSASGCGSAPPPASDHPPTGSAGSGGAMIEPPDTCATGDDCELVEACCGCNAGGKKFAIRKDAVAAFEASRPQRCADQLCPQFISHDPSCDAEAICGNRNRCRVAPHVQHQ
jgi:hypothetical protein